MRTLAFSAISTYNSYLPSIFGKMHWFEVIFKMFGRAVFEVIKVKGGCTVKAEKNQNKLMIVWIVGGDRTKTKCPQQWVARLGCLLRWKGSRSCVYWEGYGNFCQFGRNEEFLYIWDSLSSNFFGVMLGLHKKNPLFVIRKCWRFWAKKSFMHFYFGFFKECNLKSPLSKLLLYKRDRQIPCRNSYFEL